MPKARANAKAGGNLCTRQYRLDSMRTEIAFLSHRERGDATMVVQRPLLLARAIPPFWITLIGSATAWAMTQSVYSTGYLML